MSRRLVRPRLVELTIGTDAFDEPVPVRVILPRGYDATTRRYPVVYYTAGTNADETRFTDTYDGVGLTRDLPAIFVAPRGDSGYWSDWSEQGVNGVHDYERFVVDQLVPLVDAEFRTRPDPASRAILGESMGGYGALMLAARHPDVFVAVASLSGAGDTNDAAIGRLVSVSPVLQGATPDAIYGPRLTQEVRWRGHNPVDLAVNLRGLDVQVLVGNGALDPARGEGPGDLAGCATELIVQRGSVSMHRRLQRLRVPHRFVQYSWGCHSTPLFQHAFAQAVPRILRVIAQHRRAPRVFDLRAIEPTFGAHGWRFAADPARRPEFLDVRRVSRSGLGLTGTGTTTVTTPRWGPRVRALLVTVDGVSRRIHVPRSRHVRFRVDLGPATPTQQYAAGYRDQRRSRRVHLLPVRASR